MPGGTYGGMSPGFERYGGQRSSLLKALMDSLAQQRGTALSYDTTSNIYVENLAIARALMECWSNNQRLANQWDSKRMTDFIPRWEKILGLTPNQGDSDHVRRSRIGVAFSQIASATLSQTIYDTLSAALGSVFVGLVTTSSASAVVYTPTGWSVGTQLSGIDWYSTVAHLLVQVQQPAGMNDGTFYQTVSLMNPILDQMLPAWMTFDWFRMPSGSAGFYLDTGWPGAVPAGVTPVNLDNEAFT